jgi:polyisoprenyl-phosphate glycosyltransferase
MEVAVEPIPAMRNPPRSPIELSIAVPCFNEAGNLPELCRRLVAACAACGVTRFEIIFVNDGSKDRTWQVIEDFARHDSRITGVDLSRNFGHQLALTAALALCRGERVFILDADLQDPPELLGAMMARMDEGADVVYGKRGARPGEPLHRRIAARVFYRLIHLLVDFDLALDAGDFRLISRRVLDIIRAMPETHRYLRGMVGWAGFKQVAVDYDRDPRFAGKTGYSIAKLMTLALDGMTGFSIRPLRIGLYCGLAAAALSVVLIVASLVWWAVLSPPPGWTSLTIIVLLLGGVQTAMIGLVGEYVSRNFIESKRRPLYVVREVLRAEAEPAMAQLARGTER